jgi:hypothetical protein
VSPEWAWGITDWLELGAYAAVILVDRRRALSDRRCRIRRTARRGTKLLLWGRLRARLQRPVLGSRPALRRDPPIIGGRLGPVDLIVDPILDTSFQGLGALDFAPTSRVAYHFSETRAAALEHYADYGRLNKLEPLGRQQHLFAVVDY